jgi:hypothetical protein
MEERKELLVKSMEFCQGTINRMAGNSSTLKAWFLVTFSAMFTFIANSKSIGNENGYTASCEDVVWLVPMFIFPFLDAYYLKQERIFIDVYNDFQKSINSDDNIRLPFDMKPNHTQRTKYTLLNVVFSVSIGYFYFPLMAAFQALVIYHSIDDKQYVALIFPILIIILAFIFSKKTEHQSVKK